MIYCSICATWDNPFRMETEGAGKQRRLLKWCKLGHLIVNESVAMLVGK